MKVDLHTSWTKLLTKMADWMDHLIIMLTNVVLAILVLLLFVMVAKLSRKGFVKVVNQFSNN